VRVADDVDSSHNSNNIEFYFIIRTCDNWWNAKFKNSVVILGGKLWFDRDENATIIRQ